MLDPGSKHDITNKGNFFVSFLVENMKTDHSFVYITTPHALIGVKSTIFTHICDVATERNAT